MRKEIFRSGKHTDANGVVVIFSDADLKKIVDNYDQSKHKAPVVIGHPKMNNPAYGWVKSISFSDGVITAEFEDVDLDFADLVKKKRYEAASASFYTPNSPNNPIKGEYYLRHVGYLGAVPPAVKGLKVTEFSEDAHCISFNDVESTVTDPAEASKTEDNSKPDLAKVTAENETLKQTIAELKAKLAEAENAQTTKANSDFAESLIKEGRLLPKHRETVIAILNSAPANTLNFGEKGESILFSEAIKGLLSEAQTIDLAEVATKGKAADAEEVVVDEVAYAEGVDEASKALEQKIRSYMKENKCTYNEAFRAVK